MDVDWGTVAAIATAVGVAVGVWQVRAGARISQTQFEDSLDQQYRELAMDIPVDALIGKGISNTEWPKTRELIYNYLDLSNEQVALRRRKRIRKDTWIEWSDGISLNLKKPAFARIWAEVREHAPGEFSALERLADADFAEDPAKWR